MNYSQKPNFDLGCTCKDLANHSSKKKEVALKNFRKRTYQSSTRRLKNRKKMLRGRELMKGMQRECCKGFSCHLMKGMQLCYIIEASVTKEEAKKKLKAK